MLLLVDIGNTDIVFGFYSESTWQTILRTPTHQPWSPIKLQMWLVKELSEKGLVHLRPDSILISSVVPSILPQIQFIDISLGNT
jgi:type III pantothenate kinase